jgi:hypothetical protein
MDARRRKPGTCCSSATLFTPLVNQTENESDKIVPVFRHLWADFRRERQQRPAFLPLRQGGHRRLTAGADLANPRRHEIRQSA